MAIQELSSMNTTLARRSPPQLGIGGCLPNPKKLNATSTMIAVATSRVPSQRRSRLRVMAALIPYRAGVPLRLCRTARHCLDMQGQNSAYTP
jgi:hypothetical protein